MDVNAINNNSISSLNTSSSSSLQLEKTSQSGRINNSEKDALSLSISDYNKQRDELSLNIQSFNDGIAISKIAQNGISKQQEYLSNVQDKLQNINNLQNKNDIKQSINEDLRNFNQTAYETKYKNDNLLVQNYYDDKSTIDINTSTGNFSVEKTNTATFANDIFETVNNSDLNNPENVSNALNKVSTASSQLNGLSEQFSQFSKQLEEKALENIKEQNNLYKENQMNKPKDFGRESTDFSKANINANAGYLAASQANIVQAQSVKVIG